LGDPRDGLLRKIDEAMALLELAEKALGRLARDARDAGVSGSLYAVYTSLLRLREKLVEAREEAFSLPCGQPSTEEDGETGHDGAASG